MHVSPLVARSRWAEPSPDAARSRSVRRGLVRKRSSRAPTSAELSVDLFGIIHIEASFALSQRTVGVDVNGDGVNDNDPTALRTFTMQIENVAPFTILKSSVQRTKAPMVDGNLGPGEAYELRLASQQAAPLRENRLQAATHDEIWNAAQRELRAEGRIQNYLRMLWARVGRTYCPGAEGSPCGREVCPDTVQSATDAILALPDKKAKDKEAKLAALTACATLRITL